jgi:hypothetical protein
MIPVAERHDTETRRGLAQDAQRLCAYRGLGATSTAGTACRLLVGDCHLSGTVSQTAIRLSWLAKAYSTLTLYIYSGGLNN